MTTKRAECLLLFVTFCWGSSYLFMKDGLTDLGAFAIVAWRFGIAFLAAGLLLGSGWKRVTWSMVRAGALVGLMVFLAFSLLVKGVAYTSTTNAGFITSMMVVFIPFVERFVYGRPLRRSVWMTSALSLLGIGCLTLSGGLSLNPGDVFCLIGAMLCALQVSYASRLLVHMDAVTLGVLQFGFTALFGLLTALYLGEPMMPHGTSWGSMMYLGLVCSAFGFLAQLQAQRFIAAERVGILFSLEPVFAAIIGVICLHESFGFSHLAGAALVLMSVVLSGKSDSSAEKADQTAKA
ncbi:DMT family transporter [Mitsuokella sp. AF33-22]|uniref:DMT family transporter n=1 Tax=Mitsuokella sp. AF33-22 TaxID=2292047 RepID=UPI001314DEA1|nr:DMT family transporter [Mitsuokella sp. AF33-22]